MSIAAILAAAGSGNRMQTQTPKQFLPLAGKALFLHSLEALQNHPLLDHIVLVFPADRVENAFAEWLKPHHITKVSRVVAGGMERHQSVRNALEVCRDKDEIVLIHDAARPFLQPQWIDASIHKARTHGAATVAIPVSDTIKRAREAGAYETVERSNLWSIQTPQTFRRGLLEEGFRKAEETGDFGTDECYLIEKLGKTVCLVEGSARNVKITRANDLELAEKFLCTENNQMRTGTGYDVHKLAENRKLVLGGVEIEHSKGLLGHSDADVLCHAIGDALLGAASLGDLGKHFPDTDPAFKGISSLKLLEKIKDLLLDSGFTIGNVDSTIVAQKPKLAGHIGSMRANLSRILNVDISQVSVKATTTEGLGFEGSEEGISTQASVTICKARD